MHWKLSKPLVLLKVKLQEQCLTDDYQYLPNVYHLLQIFQWDFVQINVLEEINLLIPQVSQFSQLPATKSTVSIASSSTGTYFMDEFNKTMPCFTKHCPENCDSD